MVFYCQYIPIDENNISKNENFLFLKVFATIVAKKKLSRKALPTLLVDWL